MKQIHIRSAAMMLACGTAALCCVSCGNAKSNYDISLYQDTTARTEFNTTLDFTKTASGTSGAPADFEWIGQAEDGKLTGNVAVQNVTFPGYFGESYVGNFQNPTDTVILMLKYRLTAFIIFRLIPVSVIRNPIKSIRFSLTANPWVLLQQLWVQNLRKVP